MKNNKGITLISLIASIILLTILSAITIVTSVNAYNQMKFESAKTELEELQKKVDEIASDYQTYLKETTDTSKQKYIEYFKSRYGANNFSSRLLFNLDNEKKLKLSALIQEYPNEIGYSVEHSSESSTVFYFSTLDLEKYFSLKGISDVVVDFSTRKVYSVNGIKESNDSSEIYYTPSDWGFNIIRKDTSNSVEYKGWARKVSKSQNIYDVEINVSPKINNNIVEVYFCKVVENVNDEKYIKIDSFRDLSSESQTIIRVNIEGNGNYKFRLVDELKNRYNTDVLNLE